MRPSLPAIIAQACAAHGITPPMLRYKHGRTHPAKRAIAVSAIERGYSSAEVAAATGTNRDTVMRHYRAWCAEWGHDMKARA